MGNYYRAKLEGEQKRIYQRLVDGENIFLTGNAGTGKSFLVEAYSEYCEENGIKLLKAAPTGIAACNIKGVTLHRLFKLPTDVRSVLKAEKDTPVEVKNTLNLCNVILIDEISMVRIDIFDKIMGYIYNINKERQLKRRKPIQIILVGDFYQLSPVIPPEDKAILDLHYGRDIKSGFAFQSKYWKTLNVQFEKLTEIKRQEDDKEFCIALDKCKEGDCSCLNFFANSTAKSAVKDAIWVVGKNNTAKEYNLEKLAELEGKSKSFFAEYDGQASSKDHLCEDEFVCKIGARVLMTINSGEDYQNGSVGTIIDVIEDFPEDRILVRIDKKNSDGTIGGSVVEVKKHNFSKYEYQEQEVKTTVVDERGNSSTHTLTELVLTEIGSVKQFPMKLGFAVTVHKAQGQTYEAMNFKPEIFQEGQLYVALSRCKSADSLYIDGYLSQRMVKTSEDVISYYQEPDTYSFFGEDNEVISVLVPREVEKAVTLLEKVFANNKNAIIEFLQKLEKLDKEKAKAEKVVKRKTRKKSTKTKETKKKTKIEKEPVENDLFSWAI